MKKFLILISLLLLPSLAHSTNYYVANEGNDNCNSGTDPSIPWRTISKANKATLRPGDTLNFKGGQTFTGTIVLTPGDTGTSTSPVIIQSYGAGTATISSGAGRGLAGTNVSGITVRNLIFTGTTSPTGTHGVSFFSDNPAGNRGLVFDHLEIKNYGGAGLSIGGWCTCSANNGTNGYHDVTITNNSIHNNKTDNVNVYAKFPYINSNFYAAHNIIHDSPGYNGSLSPAGSGLVFGGVTGGTIEFNEAYNNGSANNNGSGGPVGIWIYDSKNFVIQNNYSHDNKSLVKDGAGFDLDQNVSNSIIQNNTSFNNQGAGYLFSQGPNNSLWTNNQALNNISTDDAQLREDSFHFFGPISNLTLSGNTVTKGSGVRGTIGSEFLSGSGGCMTGASVTGNHFTASGGIDLIHFDQIILNCPTISISFQGNFYSASPFNIVWGSTTYHDCPSWHTATGQENCQAPAPAPTVSSLSPNSGTQGSTISGIDIAGTGFISGATCSFGVGITVNSCSFSSSSHLTASVIIGASAATGGYTVTVTNPDSQSGSLTNGFTVAAAPPPPPTVTSATPSSGAQGATITSVVIAGTGFQSGATCSFGANITINSCTFNSATQLTANITIGGGAATGGRTVTVTNPDMQTGSLVNGFTVTGAPPPAPTVTSATPNSGQQGATLSSVVIAGTGFQSGAVVSFSGTGITVNSTTFNSATQLTTNISISGGATTSARNVTVTNPDTQFGTAVGAFTVTAVVNPAPTITSVTPSSGNQGATVSTSIVGTGFLASPTCSFGVGIIVNTCVRNSSTSITSNITIASGAASGGRTVTVMNTDAQSGSLPNGFTVLSPPPAPTVTSVNPTSGAQGQTLSNLQITGTGFQSGATCSFSGTGITVNSCTFNAMTQLTANITISGAAATTTRNVTVTNPDTQSGTGTGLFTVVASAPPPPTLTSVSPSTGAQGQTITGILLGGSNFQSGANSSFGSGITVNSTQFNSSSQLMVSITIASGASVGARDVTVTNPDAQSSTLSSAFSVTAPPSKTVSWTDNSNNEDGFKVYRSDGDAPYLQVGSVGQNVTSFLDSSPPLAISGCYEVSAFNSVGESAKAGGSRDACFLPINSQPPFLAIGANTGSGALATNSGSGGSTYNGTWANAQWISDPGFGSSLNFNAAGAKFIISNLTNYAPQRTWEARIYQIGPGGGSFGRIFDKRNAGAESELFYFDNGSLRFLRIYSGTNGSWAVPAPTLNVWHHVALSFNEGAPAPKPRIWIDGVEQVVEVTSSPSGTPVNNTDPLYWGNRGDGTRNWDGYLDEFRVYDRLLTTFEVYFDSTTALP